MSTPAIIMMVCVQLSVTLVTAYFFRKVLSKPADKN